MNPASRPCSLSRCFNAPGGITADEALSRAELNLEFNRKAMLNTIDTALERIGLVLLGLDASPAERPYDMLISDAETLHGVSGTFGHQHLGIAAYQLREHVRWLQADGSWDHEGLQAFAYALRRLRSSSADPRAAELLGALPSLTGRAAAPAGPMAREEAIQ